MPLKILSIAFKRREIRMVMRRQIVGHVRNPAQKDRSVLGKRYSFTLHMEYMDLRCVVIERKTRSQKTITDSKTIWQSTRKNSPLWWDVDVVDPQ
jgi:hypothetical protein